MSERTTSAARRNEASRAGASHSYDLKGKRVYVAGHRGMVGSAIVRRLAREDCEILTVSRADLDLTNADAVRAWMFRTRPHAIFMAAAKVGGILANDRYPADFLYQNLLIETNVIEAARLSGVEKMLFLGSSCIYPKFAPQPIEESALLSGPLEPTNEAYAIAKIAGIKLAWAYRRQYGCNFISAMPCNLYGPGDNYDLQSSHVIPALIRKAHEAKLRGDEDMMIWGSGSPRREFLHVEDCADALVFVMQCYSDEEHINVGSGSDLSILELAWLVRDAVGFMGAIEHDFSKPDGTPQKLMSNAKLQALGWRPKITLRAGLADAYRAFLEDN